MTLKGSRSDVLTGGASGAANSSSEKRLPHGGKNARARVAGGGPLRPCAVGSWSGSTGKSLSSSDYLTPFAGLHGGPVSILRSDGDRADTQTFFRRDGALRSESAYAQASQSKRGRRSAPFKELGGGTSPRVGEHDVLTPVSRGAGLGIHSRIRDSQRHRAISGGRDVVAAAAPSEPHPGGFGGNTHELRGLSQLTRWEGADRAVVHACPERCDKTPTTLDTENTGASGLEKATPSGGRPRAQKATELANGVGGQHDVLPVSSQGTPPGLAYRASLSYGPGRQFLRAQT